MGVVEFENMRIRQKEIEVRALVALTNQDVIVSAKIEAVHKLLEIAYPNKVAEKLNQTQLGVE